MKSPFAVILLILNFLLLASGLIFAADPQQTSLDMQMASYFSDALKNSDISYSVREDNGKNYLQFLRFGLKETFINDFLHGLPPQKDGDTTIKELFLQRMEAKGNQLDMLIGGAAKYKPADFFQASANFIVPAHLSFDQSKKEITFVIESKFEKLRTKKFNLDVKKLSNSILKKLKANDSVKRIQIPELMSKIERFKPLFNGFVRENGFLYISAVPEQPLWVSPEIIQVLEAFRTTKK